MTLQFVRPYPPDESYRQQGLGSQFLQLCELWLKKQGIQSLQDEARPDAVKFYRKNGYVEMPFEDPTGEPPSPQDVAMEKKLCVATQSFGVETLIPYSLYNSYVIYT
jgi:hypothetical protein